MPDRGHRPGDEPPPIPNAYPAVQDLVLEDLMEHCPQRAARDLVGADLMERKRFGIERYGTPLQPFNGRDAVVDAYQELIDFAMYARQKAYEGYPNSAAFTWTWVERERWALALLCDIRQEMEDARQATHQR